MRLVGLTYDLRQEYLARGFSEEETAEFDSPETIDAIENALDFLGYAVNRIGNVQRLVEGLAKGERWDMVFNIAEGRVGPARESQVPALLEAYGIPHTFSNSLVMAITLHKGFAKSIVRDLGVPTPDFVEIRSEDEADAVELPFPLFAKPIAEGTSKGISAASLIRNKAELRQTCRELLRRYRQPVLVEEYLPGREFTVGVLGSGSDIQVPGVLEVVLKPGAASGDYTYETKERYEELVEYRLCREPLSGEAAVMAVDVWRGLGCNDAGRVDLRMDAQGRLRFIEVNPLPGLHPSHSDLPILCSLAEIPYVELIRRIMESAERRSAGQRSDPFGIFPEAASTPGSKDTAHENRCRA